MEIVLLILKIIGITLLVLLGVVLVLVLLVLFFPISYRISASYHEAVKARVKVHWLFHLVSVTLDYGEDVKSCILRLFGITLMDFMNPKPKKEKKSKKIKEPKENTDTLTKPEVQLEDFEGVVTENTLSEEDASDDVKQIESEETEETEEKLSIWQKIKKTVETIIQKIKELIQKGIDIKEKINKWIEILQRERTKIALSKVKEQIINILKHILPRKWNAYVEMGFDDPATTGQILGYYWMFIGLYGNHFICVPDFEHKVLKANVDAKGRIQIIQFVYVVFRFLFDKDLVYLRKIISKVNS